MWWVFCCLARERDLGSGFFPLTYSHCFLFLLRFFIKWTKSDEHLKLAQVSVCCALLVKSRELAVGKGVGVLCADEQVLSGCSGWVSRKALTCICVIFFSHRVIIVRLFCSQRWRFYIGTLWLTYCSRFPQRYPFLLLFFFFFFFFFIEESGNTLANINIEI